MSDIFQQVDEEVRREQLKKLWERYGSLLIAACVLVVLATAGWRTYEWYQAKEAAEASAKFEAAVALVNDGKNKEAEEAFGQIAAGSTTSYRMLAKFREAGELVRRDPKAAAAIYDKLARVPAQRPRAGGALRLARRRCHGDAQMERNGPRRCRDATRYARPDSDADGAGRHR